MRDNCVSLMACPELWFDIWYSFHLYQDSVLASFIGSSSARSFFHVLCHFIYFCYWSNHPQYQGKLCGSRQGIIYNSCFNARSLQTWDFFFFFKVCVIRVQNAQALFTRPSYNKGGDGRDTKSFLWQLLILKKDTSWWNNSQWKPQPLCAN